MQKFWIILLGGLILVFGGSTIFVRHGESAEGMTYHNSTPDPQLVILNSQSILPCPECGCWARWVQLQQRSYLDGFALLPQKEKILTICDYRVFLTSVQVLPDTFELLIYAQNPKTNKPYIKSKNISIYKQTDLVPVFNIKDNNLVTEIRYVNPEPADYWLKVGLEDESGCPLTTETCFVLGSPPPNPVYMVIFGGLIISVLIVVLYLRRKRKITG